MRPYIDNEYHNYKALGSSFQVLNNEKNENSSIYNNNLDIFDNNISLAYNHSLNSKTNDNSIIQKNNIFHNKGKTYESNKNINIENEDITYCQLVDGVDSIDFLFSPYVLQEDGVKCNSEKHT